MLRVPCLVALLLLMPTASAFSATQHDLHIAYDADATPVIVASGALGVRGLVGEGLFLGGADGTSLDDIIDLAILDSSSGQAQVIDVPGGSVEIAQGGLLWTLGEGTLAIDVSAPYAIGLALPQAPLPPSADGLPPAGFLLGGEDIRGSAQWRGGTALVAPLDAVVTVRDARGQPLPEWNARHVNAEAGRVQDAEGLRVVFRASGPFQARLDAAILAGAAGEGADVAMTVSRASEDRFAQTVALLDRSTRSLTGGEGPGLAGQGGPLRVLEQASPLLNGALLLVQGDGSTAAPVLLESTWGAQEFAIGAFNVVRGDDMRVAWSDGEMRVEGEPSVALGREGFAVDPPRTVGIFPIVSLVLWGIALASAIVWLVKRPPKGQALVSLRLLTFGISVVTLLVALFVWDRSFTQTFGTGVMAFVGENGLSSETLPHIGVLALIELIPWGIAGALFALPVRIAMGVALRYLGRGKSYKGIATASGLVALAVFGPIYALWCFNIVWSRASQMISGP